MDDGFFLDGSRLEAECRARGLDPEKIQRGPLTESSPWMLPSSDGGGNGEPFT